MSKNTLYLPQFNSLRITNLNFNTMVSFELLFQMRDFSLDFLKEHGFAFDPAILSLSADDERVFLYFDDYTFEFELSQSGKDFTLVRFTANYELPF